MKEYVEPFDGYNEVFDIDPGLALDIWAFVAKGEREQKITRIQKSITPSAASPAELPPLLSDDYDLGPDGPKTRLFRLADERAAGGEDYADALFSIAQEQPDLVGVSDAWCYSLATNDESGLPDWLRPKFRRVLRRLDAVQDTDAGGGIPDPAAKFNEAVEVRSAELERGGMSRSDALAAAQDELYERFADMLE